MAFLNIPHERAYYTGAIRSNLARLQIARRLTRQGVEAELADDRLTIHLGDDSWVFEAWQPDGLGSIGWLRFTDTGDINRLSRALAAAGLRHRLDHSRPLAVDDRDMRCVTRYLYRWNEPGLAPAGPPITEIETSGEPVEAIAT